MLLSDRIYFSKEFCQKLVDKTIRSSYFTIYYLKNFSEQLTNLMNCKSGNSTKIEFEVPFWTEQQVKHCFYFKNKYFFFFCEKYCQKFHLTKASDIFDGNLAQLRKFYEHIKLHREDAFYYPSNNILMDGITYEEDYLNDYMESVMEDPIFMKPVLDNKRLDKFKSDVVYVGGFDPFESTEGNSYPIVIASSPIPKIIALLLLWMI